MGRDKLIKEIKRLVMWDMSGGEDSIGVVKQISNLISKFEKGEYFMECYTCGIAESNKEPLGISKSGEYLVCDKCKHKENTND